MRHRSLWGILVTGSLVFAGPNLACASMDQDPVDAPAQEDDAVREAREAAEAARAAVADASKTAKDAERSRRRSLLAAVDAEETLLEALEAAGDTNEVAASRTRLKSLYGKLGTYSAGVAPAVRGALAGRAGSDRPYNRNRPARSTPKPALQDLNPGLDTLLPVQDRKSKEAIPAALTWLAENQEEDGRWEPHGRRAPSTLRHSPEGGASYNAVGVTSLATLAFLGHGETHKSDKHGETVGKALRYLKSVQDPEGCFGLRVTQHYVYNHAFATLAMTEAYAITKSPKFKDSARRGVEFILKSQNPYLGWRYGVRPGDNDTSVTTWMIMALYSAKQAGIEVDDMAFRGAMAWYDKMIDPRTGRAGYMIRGSGPARMQSMMDAFPPEKSESTTAMAFFGRTLCGEEPGTDVMKQMMKRIDGLPPKWNSQDGSIDMYYWYFGTLSTFQAGGQSWKAWNRSIIDALVPHQRGADQDWASGSFNPAGPWGQLGGRVYSTALCTMMLEISHRYDRVFRGK